MSDIRKAVPSDIDALELIYEHVHDAIESGAETTGWRRGIYPTRKTPRPPLNAAICLFSKPTVKTGSQRDNKYDSGRRIQAVRLENSGRA